MRRLDPYRRFPLAAACVALMLAVACGGPPKSPTLNPVDSDKNHAKRMAESQYNGGRLNEALETLREAIARFPEDAPLLHQYGSYCLQAGRDEEAAKSFRRVLELDPHLTDAHNALGVAYLKRHDYAAAEAQFRNVLDDPAYPTPQLAHLNLGLLYAEQGRHEEAISSMRRSVGIDPKYFQGHFHLASMLERIGSLLEAAREYEVAEPAYRNDGEYWYRRGFTYYRLGEQDKARESLLRVRSIAPGSESAARADELLSVLD